ncbi:NACHT domain-containing protein [Streptomyces caatingaensis]|uniref:NACHT domain-containing protein n=1 Tax=Streptomyces caatingaensis TaxID=1678637 RepID=UPI0006727BD4|nr:NACHT domain-containing protein [Streptomyces caatingaensis]
MGRRWAVVRALCGVLVPAPVVAWALSGDDAAGRAAWSAGAATAGLFGVLALWAWRARPQDGRSTHGQVTDATEVLARLVHRQWEEEAMLRQLFSPAPLPVLWWDSALPDVSDHRELIGDPVSCRADAPRELAVAFRHLPHQRLVVLGPAGAGKTTFAVLLTLALLRDRVPGTPVPVLLSLASFDPSRHSVPEWLARQIAAGYPALADVQAFGPTVVDDLLAGGRVIPVLDGLDELPAPGRPAVLAALKAAFPSHAPLVLTCRTAAYARAVAGAGVLTGAAVVEPAPLDAADALASLRLAAPPGAAQRRWEVLARHVAEVPQGPVALALRSPLLVTLARSVYADAGGDPAELADSGRFPTVAAVEQHLLDALVPGLYDRARRRDPGRRCGPGASGVRHLAFLARGLGRQGTHDLAWWQLYRWVPVLDRAGSRALLWSAVAAGASLAGYGLHHLAGPRPQLGLPGFLLVTGGVALALWCMQCLAARIVPAAGARSRPLRVAAATALCGALANALFQAAVRRVFTGAGTVVTVQHNLKHLTVYGLGLFLVLHACGPPAPPPVPSRGSPALSHWRKRLPRAGATVVGAAVLTGAALHLYVLIGIWPSDPWTRRTAVPAGTVWATGAVTGALFGTVLGVVRSVRTAASRQDVTSPAESVRADRFMTLAGAAAAALLFHLPDDVALVMSLATGRGPAPPVSDVALFALSELLPVGVVLGLTAFAWPHYGVARLVLAARGQLPLRLQAFLADAHRLGILRRVGPVYQFRHASLQHRLAATADGPGRHPARARGGRGVTRRRG